MPHSLNPRHPRGCHSRIQTWPPHQTGFFVESKIPYGPFSIQNGRSYPLLRKYGCENGHYRIPWESVSENSQMLLRKGAVSYPRQKYRIDEENPVGVIYSENYSSVIDIILSRVNIKRKKNEEEIKFKNKKAAEIFAKLHGKEKKDDKADKRFELANIISSLSVHSKNLNLIDIGNLTVFQLYDQYQKQQIEDYYEIMKRSVSIWGDSDNKFDILGWLKLYE